MKAYNNNADPLRNKPLREQVRLALLWGTPITVVAFLLGYTLSQYITIGVNLSGSIPVSEAPFFVVIHDGYIPERGNYVAFKPSHKLKYYHGYDLWAKKLYGLPGDTVSYDGKTFSINGIPVVKTKVNAKDGGVLNAGPTGVLPACHFFVATEHPDGYDSRYDDIGWITCEQIVGSAYVIP